MKYEQFAKEYEQAFNSACKYNCDQAGSKIFTDKMADLADAYPDFLNQFEKIQEQKAILEARFKNRKPLSDNGDLGLIEANDAYELLAEIK